ncbi:carbonic anhydrase [Streptomyces capillispiralis]|uniref:carbonic anhydrase n=1 Tax=Streptomyces capillispiralis TaxID=68182 RepID=UPI0036BD82E2
MSDASPVAPATPREAFDLLTAGNRRFAAATPRHPNQDAVRRADTASAQHPHAVLLGCSDSRLAAEIIFDQGLGDLFVVRTAGHAVGPEVLGSIEYGVSVLGCPLVVVLGHDACGAVAATRAAVRDGAPAPGYLRDVIERVTPSVLAAQAAGVSEEDEFIATHVRHTVDLVMDRSQELADRVASGRTAVVGLTYRLAEGTVRTVTSRGLDLPADGTAMPATASAPTSAPAPGTASVPGHR